MNRQIITGKTAPSAGQLNLASQRSCTMSPPQACRCVLLCQNCTVQLSIRRQSMDVSRSASLTPTYLQKRMLGNKIRNCWHCDNPCCMQPQVQRLLASQHPPGDY